MYLPAHFKEQQLEEIHRIIAEYPFATLVVHGPDGLDANHLPFLLDTKRGEHGTLLAHVARSNPIWQEVKENDAVLAIFQAEDAYISPNWYPSKRESDRQVPTWNYQVVHVHGRIQVHDDVHFVRAVVAQLTQKHESLTNPAGPWKMSDSARDYIDQMLTQIVGLEIEIDRIVGKSKLSQNRENRDRIGAAEELARLGEDAISTAMLHAALPGNETE